MLRKLVRVVSAVGFAALFFGAPAAFAQTAPPMGAAQSFAVLGGTTVTNTGPSVITGDVGVSPGSAVTGFPPGVLVGGTIHTTATSLAGPAQTAVTSVYNNLDGQLCPGPNNLTGQDLGGLILLPGVYCFDAAAQLTGTLTLSNPTLDPNAVYIFQIGSALTTASNASVVLSAPGSPCNVFWQVTSSATLGTGTSFVGNIVALSSVTMNTNASLQGRALARNGAVTLDSNTVNASACAVPAGCPAIDFAPPTVPNGTVGVPYSVQFTGSGGTGPYAFSVTAGSLPPGLTLTGGGLLSGTPTVANPAVAFTIRAVDANGCFVTRPYTMAVLAAVPTLPQAFTLLLALALTAVGYFLLRQRSRAG